jgi:hypothetical protein
MCAACGHEATDHSGHATATDAQGQGDGALRGGSVTSQKTSGGLYAVELTGSLTVASGTLMTLTAEVRDATGALAKGLDLQVQFIHTAMGHGGPKVPLATETTEGLYRLDGLQPTMEGTWALTLRIGNETASFSVAVK